ncbi:MAG: YIP1 family protein [Lachnospiraceae bacterium]|nr:YIP1 family protein [Lachnospiraceae bacterium]MBP3578989.1 YIP1 family protein [Lachnospiraceae bacterium]
MGKYFSKEKWSYMFYTITHPMDGYYWIRHRDYGSVPLAILMVILFSFSFTANRLMASFVVNDLDPRGVDLLFELLGVLSFYLLLCVSNWSITCLMNGEGRLKDIAIAVGYGTVPMTLVMVLSTIISQVIADDEQAFYGILIGVGIAYGVIMMLVGIMQVHNYTLGKTLLTLLLTFVAALIIVFLLLLLSNLLGMVYNFFHSIYTELIFRV